MSIASPTPIRPLTFSISLLLCFFIIISLITPVTGFGSNWRFELIDATGDTGNWPSLTVDSLGRVHVVYWSRDAGQLKYAVRNGPSWSVEPIVAAPSSSHGRISLNLTEQPVVAYADGLNLFYAYRDGATWTSEVVDSGWFSVGEITVNGTDLPSITYHDVSNRNANFAYRNTTGWNTEIIEWQGDVGSNIESKLGPDGEVHAVYVDLTRDSLKYARRTGSVWDILEWDPGPSPRAPDLAFDSLGRPWLSFGESAGPVSWLRVGKPEGVSWVVIGSDVQGSGPILALDSRDYPRIAYCENGLRFARLQGSVWTSEFVTSAQCEITFRLEGDVPHMAYYGGPFFDIYYVTVGNDLEAPDSRVLPIIPYWANATRTITATAADAQGFVASVSLWYRFSPDNATWGSWAVHGALSAAPWSWSFPLPDGAGWYELLTTSVDDVGNAELPPAVADAQAGHDVGTPVSTLDPVPYWQRGPVPVTAQASDDLSGVASVTLSYRHSADNISWTPWNVYWSLTAPPWSWNFDLVDGEGFYELRTSASDFAGNVEPWRIGISLAFDVNAPVSRVMGSSPYWHASTDFNVSATASDSLSGVADVGLWYSLSFDNVTFSPWVPYGVLFDPPWNWTFPFPSGEGHYRFRAIARDIAGNEEGPKNGWEAEAGYRLDPPPVAVARVSPLVVSTGENVSFDGSNSTDDNGIVAYLWDFGDGVTDPNPIATHAYASRGAFSSVLMVWDSAGQNDTDVVMISVVNRPPVADAGPDQTVAKYVTTTLDGTASYDADGDALTYSWAQTGGPSVSLSDPSAVVTTFAPASAGTYTFRLRVTDPEGAWGEDEVAIAVPNAPPIARLAANPPTVRVSRPVAFDGTGSSDPDGLIVDYAFDFGDGAGTNGAAATAIHAYASIGSYVVILTVTDDEGATNSTQVTILIFPNAPPTPVPAALPATGTLDTTFLFDGANSTDDVGVVSWQWDFGDGAAADGERANHRFAAKGPFTVTLTVTDDEGASASATLTVRVVNRPPVITDAQPSGSVSLLAGRTQRFVVTAADPDGDPLSYAWTVDGAAAGTDAAALDFAAGPGVYRVNVTVSDGESAAWHEWTVRVETPPAETPMETNWKPAVAATFTVILAIAGAWSSGRRPWKGETSRKAVLRAFAVTALPFVLAEAGTGVVSLATGFLSIPPLLGAGTAVDGSLLVVGVATSLLRVRRGQAPQ